MYAAQEWIETIERAKDFAIGQSLTNSYSGDSTFNDLSSTLSSPTSTLGNNEALEGVNIPTAGRLRKGEMGDGESIKGRTYTKEKKRPTYNNTFFRKEIQPAPLQERSRCCFLI